MSHKYPSSRTTLYVILWHYNRHRELQRLLYWAKQKQLKHPLCLYRSRLEDEAICLNRYQLHYPRLAYAAYIIHLLNKVCFPPTHYPKRGSASGYTRRAILANGSSISDR